PGTAHHRASALSAGRECGFRQGHRRAPPRTARARTRRRLDAGLRQRRLRGRRRIAESWPRRRRGARGIAGRRSANRMARTGACAVDDRTDGIRVRWRMAGSLSGVARSRATHHTARMPPEPSMADLTLKQSLAAMDVAEYLRQHPRFLEHFPDVATELVMPRENGPAASLAAYQLEALRARNRELNDRLAELVAIAGDNEQLMVRVHTLTVGLLRDDNLSDVLKSFVGALNEDFHSDLVRVLLFRDGADLPRADWLVCV